MAGVSLRRRRRALGHRVAGKDRDTVGCAQRIGIDTKLYRQRLVKRQQARRRRWLRLPWLVKPRQVTHIGIVEGEQRRSGDAHSFRLARPSETSLR
jgi:hypothetical protein